MGLGDTLARLARGVPFSSLETEELRLLGNNLERAGEIVRTWSEAGSSAMNVESAFFHNAKFFFPAVESAAYSRITNQAISHNTWTSIEWVTQEWNSGLVSWSDASPTTITPVGTGLRMGFRWSGLVNFANNTTGSRAIRLDFDGNAFVLSRLDPSGTLTTVCPFTIALPIDPPDNVFSIQVFQNSGGALNVAQAFLLVELVGR